MPIKRPVNDQSKPALLIMTATITPPAGAVDLHRVDPQLRLQDYLEALAFYLDPAVKFIDRIVFVENSGADLAPLKALCTPNISKKVEFLSFFGLDYPSHYNRGYGEFKLLDFAFSKSRLLNELSENEKWWKVTGRLKVSNIDKMVRTAPDSYGLYADFRPKRSWVDVRLLSFSRSGYRDLMLGLYLEFASIKIEDVFFKRFANQSIDSNGEPSDHLIVREFRSVPRFEGFGGWMNTDYSSRKFRFIYTLRGLSLFCRNLFRT